MPTTPTRHRELTLPVAALTALRDALEANAGPDTAADALRTAGHAAGDTLFRLMSGTGAEGLDALPMDQFWKRLSLLFSSRGWGQLAYSEAHPGVGALDAVEWAEARREPPTDRPSCHFTTGVLANLLGRAANADVAVIEVECQSRGDQRCRFLFGGQDAVFAVYRGIAAGDAPDSAIARIG